MKLYATRVEPRPAGPLLRAAFPALARLRFDPTATLAARLDSSPLPRPVLGATFARTARYAARAAGGGLPTVAVAKVVQAVAEPLLAGRWAAAPPRSGALAGAVRVSVDRVAELVKTAGVAEQVEVDTGLALDEHVARMSDLPSLVQSVAAGLPELHVALPSTGAADTDPGETATVTDPGETATVTDPGETATATGERGGHVVFVDPHLDAAHLSALTHATFSHVTVPTTTHVLPFSVLSAVLSSTAVQVREQGVAPPVDELAQLGQGVDLPAGGLVARVPAQHLSTLASIVMDAGATADTAAAVTRLASLRTAVTAHLGIAEPIVPPMLAALPRQGLASLVAAVVEATPSLLVPADRPSAPPLQVLDPPDARTVVLTRLDPAVSFHRMLDWIVQVDPARARRRSPSHPVMAAPRLAQPVVERLTRLDAGWVLGGTQTLPPNSIAVLRSNPQFVEALLAGANTEMARELVWRGYPTDSMGTCLPRFWPTPVGADGVAPDDVAPIAEWGDRLGSNPAADQRGARREATIVVVRGDLLRRYPQTVVSAVFGTTTEQGDDLVFVKDPNRPVAKELFRGPLPPDVTYVGLDVAPEELTASSGAGEWFVALTQPIEGPRFGLDDELLGTQGQADPADLDDLSWQRFAASGLVRSSHLVLAPLPAGTWPPDLGWGPGGDAGTVAAALLQLPFQLLLPAKENLL
jgi:hypothetical protein